MWVLFEDNIKPPKVFQPPVSTRNARFQKPAKSGSPSKKESITNQHPKKKNGSPITIQKRTDHQSPSKKKNKSPITIRFADFVNWWLILGTHLTVLCSLLKLVKHPLPSDKGENASKEEEYLDGLGELGDVGGHHNLRVFITEPLSPAPPWPLWFGGICDSF